MRIVESAAGSSGADGDWADRTRRVLTRDLLLRAHLGQPTEGQALHFRALHLNLPLVREIADGLGLSQPERVAAEPHALDGLVEALGAFDPCGTVEFADFAAPFVEREIRRSLEASAGHA